MNKEKKYINLKQACECEKKPLRFVDLVVEASNDGEFVCADICGLLQAKGLRVLRVEVEKDFKIYISSERTRNNNNIVFKNSSLNHSHS